MKRIGLLFISFIVCCTLVAQTLADRLDALVSSDKLLTTSEVGISVFNLTQGNRFMLIRIRNFIVRLPLRN